MRTEAQKYLHPSVVRNAKPPHQQYGCRTELYLSTVPLPDEQANWLPCSDTWDKQFWHILTYVIDQVWGPDVHVGIFVFI